MIVSRPLYIVGLLMTRSDFEFVDLKTAIERTTKIVKDMNTNVRTYCNDGFLEIREVATHTYFVYSNEP